MNDKVSLAGFKAGTTILTENGNVNIESIKEGDIVITTSRSKYKVESVSWFVSDNNIMVRVDGMFPTCANPDQKFFAKKFLYKGAKGELHYSQPEFYPLSVLNVNDRIALPILDLNNNEINWITDDIAHLIGAFIATGRVSVYNNAITIRPGYYHAKQYADLLDKSGLVYNITSGNGSTARYDIFRNDSGLNKRFFDICLSCGYFKDTRRFPKEIFESPIHIVSECIKGYGESGGYTFSDKKHSDCTIIKFSSQSITLMNDLIILLRSIGEFPVSHTYKRDVSIRDSYEVSYDPVLKNNSSMFKVDDDYGVLWSNISSIKNDFSKYKLYSLTLTCIDENDISGHTIISNGAACSNIGGKPIMRKIK